MSKSERRDLIDKLIADGEMSVDEVIAQVAQESGVQAATVRKDIGEMYPDLLNADTTDADTSSDVKEKVSEALKGTDFSVATEKETAKVVEIASTGNPEMDKGRVKSYEVPDGEEGIVHVELEKVSFARSGANAGRKTSKPKVQKFDVRAWNNFRKNARNLGFSYVKVLHAPEGVATDVVEIKSTDK